MAEHAIEQQLVHFRVVRVLITGRETIAEDRDVPLRARWTGTENLRDRIGHETPRLLNGESSGSIARGTGGVEARPCLQRITGATDGGRGRRPAVRPS